MKKFKLFLLLNMVSLSLACLGFDQTEQEKNQKQPQFSKNYEQLVENLSKPHDHPLLDQLEKMVSNGSVFKRPWLQLIAACKMIVEYKNRYAYLKNDLADIIICYHELTQKITMLENDLAQSKIQDQEKQKTIDRLMHEKNRYRQLLTRDIIDG